MAPSPERVFRSRRVVLPDGVRAASLRVRDGRILSIGPWDQSPATDDLGDLALMAGVVDTHVHIDDPGRAEWEGFESATRAALVGGVTTLVDMPLNSIPATTRHESVRAKLLVMARRIAVDVGLWGGVIPGNAAEIAGLAAAGVLGFKCFLSPSGVDEFPHVSDADLERAWPALLESGLPLLVHAEDPAVIEQADPRRAPRAVDPRQYAEWLASRPAAAEVRAIERLVALVERTPLRVHVVHVSSAAALAVLARAKAAGLPITAETCPHYLTFDASQIDDGATAFKCAPPIRTTEDREALWTALADGTLDLVASDHSPCPPALKRPESGDFFAAWGGIASLELTLPVVWTGARARGHDLAAVSKWLSAAPAALAGLERHKGALKPGLDADFIAFDPDSTWAVHERRLHQRHPVTPYHGVTLRGRVRGTWLRGERIGDGETVLAEKSGRWLHRDGRAVDPVTALT